MVGRGRGGGVWMDRMSKEIGEEGMDGIWQWEEEGKGEE